MTRLGHVGQVAGDPVAGLHAEPAQGRGEGADLPAQRAQEISTGSLSSATTISAGRSSPA